MLTVDTNIVARLLLDDDPLQAKIARSLFNAQEIWIAKTVLLEAHWVLRTIYKYEAEATRASLASIVGLPNVITEDREAVTAALVLAQQGLSFPDALNLMSTPENARFLSFDKDLVRRARRAGVRKIDEA